MVWLCFYARNVPRMLLTDDPTMLWIEHEDFSMLGHEIDFMERMETRDAKTKKSFLNG